MSGEPTESYPPYVPPGSMSRPPFAPADFDAMQARPDIKGDALVNALAAAAGVVPALLDGGLRRGPGEQVLEIRSVSGRLHVARKAKHPDEWDPPNEPYDTYGPGETYETCEFNTDDEADASSVDE